MSRDAHAQETRGTIREGERERQKTESPSFQEASVTAGRKI
jgi:hypothetical protein